MASERIDDGFPTTIDFAAIASGTSLLFWEKEVTPPGVQGGGENDTTTMRNTTWRTKAPKKLKTMSPMNFIASYDPAVYDQILTLIQTNTQITVTFADGSTLVFWGWLDEFTPGASVEGEQPTATCTIIPSNQNASKVETAPVLTQAA
jgi:hypothetical protein